MNKRSNTLLISGLLIILLTIFIFFIATENRITITWLCFVFMLLAELILFGTFILVEYYSSKTSQIVLRSGCTFTALAYSMLSILISIIYLISDNEKVKLYLVLQFILLAITLILLMIFFTTANSVKLNNDKTIYSCSKINSIVDKITLINNNNQNTKYKKPIFKILEELKYSDTSTSVAIDDDIELKIIKLEVALLNDNANKDIELNNLFEEILLLINKRKLEVKNMKLGGI
jgi:hypothetical protein